MSYGCGGTLYADKIEKYAKKIFGSNVFVYKDFMDKSEYWSFLESIDVAIFDNKYQAALGNIFLLLYLDKKLYLCKKGIISKELREDGIEVYDADRIGKVSVEDFFRKNKNLTNIQYGYNRLDRTSIAKQWEEAFKRIMEG